MLSDAVHREATPAPASDRVYGSKQNATGSASTGQGVTFSPAVVRGLRAKVESHNSSARYKTNLTALKAVYRRGAGAFSTSHRPGMTRNQWSMGRVNAFLRLLDTGRPKNPKYTTDNDLLPDAHPRSTKEATMEHDSLAEALSMAERKRYAVIVRRLPDGRSEYKFPIPDKAHAQAALAYVNRSDLTPTERAKVVRKAYRVLGLTVPKTRKKMAEVMAEVTKTDMGMTFPSGAYAYVPDPARPSTWKVRLWEDPENKITKASASRASQALSPAGFRGNQVKLPKADLPSVRRKVAAAWKTTHPDEQLPKHLVENDQEMEIGLADQNVDIVSGMESNVLEQEQEFGESAHAGVDELSKNEVVVTVLEPGFNRSGARYYTSEAVAHAVSEGLFNNRKMYVNHPSASEMRDRPERNLTDWVSTVKETWVDEETGAIKARIKVVQNWFGDFLKQLQENEALPDVGLSIFAQGQVQRKKMDGRLTDVVERFTRALSVDWVTEPGAGGRVDAIWESYQPVRLKEQETNVLNTMSATEAVATLREQRPDVIEILEAERHTEEQVREAEAAQSAAAEQIGSLEQELAAKQIELEQIKASLVVAEQHQLIGEALGEIEIPQAVRDRVAAQIAEPVLSETGELDVDALKAKISELVEAEAAYAEQLVAESRPAGGRGISGLGDRPEPVVSSIADKVEADIARRMGIAQPETEA